MKRNDWLIITSTLFYSLLFYNQTAGINFFVFNLLLVILLFIKDNTLIRNTNWLIAAAGSLFSSACIAIHGDALTVVADIISLALLSALSFNAQTSVIMALMHSAYSWAASPVIFMVDRFENNINKSTEKAPKKMKWTLVIVPLLITLVFFFMYRSSSTLFDALADKINFNFISWSWICFTLIGALLLYGFLRNNRIQQLDAFDARTVNELEETNVKLAIFFGKELSIVDENFSATLVFALLNGLLLIVNALDIDFMFGGSKLPLGVSHKQFVHQGTDMLITSIIIAIGLILFYFRGSLNFYSKNKPVKLLATAWIAQNAFMLFSTACRNHAYINELGLTYKRIGVYVYLLLTLIGLITTFIKVRNAKTNMYLFRRNGWIFYSLLIILALPDWAKIVTGYNVTHIKELDAKYLMSLNDNVVPNLLPYYNNAQSKGISDTIFRNREFSTQYCEAVYRILNMHQYSDIRSWCYDDEKVYNQISSGGFVDDFKIMSLSGMYLTAEDLKLFARYKHLQELHLHWGNIGSVQELNVFPDLKILDLSCNSAGCKVWLDISGINKLTSLQELDLTGDPVVDYAPLYTMQNLKCVHVTSISVEQFAELQLKLPNTKIDKSSTFYNQ